MTEIAFQAQGRNGFTINGNPYTAQMQFRAGDFDLYHQLVPEVYRGKLASFSSTPLPSGPLIAFTFKLREGRYAFRSGIYWPNFPSGTKAEAAAAMFPTIAKTSEFTWVTSLSNDGFHPRTIASISKSFALMGRGNTMHWYQST